MYALVNIFLNLNINKIFINRQTVFEVLAYNSNVIDRRYAGIGRLAGTAGNCVALTPFCSKLRIYAAPMAEGI